MSASSQPSVIEGPIRVALVSCYELGRPPLGLARVATHLTSLGIRATLFDLSGEGGDPKAIAGTDLVVIATPMLTALRLGIEFAQALRAQRPAAQICFAGDYAGLLADNLLGTSADFVLAGVYEGSLASLAEWSGLKTGGEPPDLPGLSTFARRRPPALAKLPAKPASPGLFQPLDRYAKVMIGADERVSGAIEASRGCAHRCRHCPIPPIFDGRVFLLPPEVVIADASNFVEAGARHLSFTDPDFLNAPKHALLVAERLHQTFPQVSFDFTAKVEHLLAHAAILPRLKEQGLLFVISAVESLSDRVLGLLDKGHSREDVFRLAELSRSIDLHLRPTFLPFTPWSTLDEYRELLDFIETEDWSQNVDPIQLSVRLLIPPGSLLAEVPELLPHLRGFKKEALGFSWAHPDPQMDTLQRRVFALTKDLPAGDPSWVPKIRRLAEDATGEAGRHDRREVQVRARLHRLVPRLTEPWFC